VRVFFFWVALLCVLSAQAQAVTPGISGEWYFYGNQNDTVRISEEAGILEDGTTGISYVLLADEGFGRHRVVAGKGGSHSGDVRTILHVHENLLLFLGIKNPILVRKGVRFKALREKIRGCWHYAAQMNNTYYYDAEFDLDSGKIVDISRSESGAYIRSEGRSFELILDAQAELALQAGGVVYHLTRLGADFLVLEGSYATSTRNGYKILLERVCASQAVKTTQRADAKSRTAKAAKAQARKSAR
jgi:hypothetical protein